MNQYRSCAGHVGDSTEPLLSDLHAYAANCATTTQWSFPCSARFRLILNSTWLNSAGLSRNDGERTGFSNDGSGLHEANGTARRQCRFSGSASTKADDTSISAPRDCAARRHDDLRDGAARGISSPVLPDVPLRRLGPRGSGSLDRGAAPRITRRPTQPGTLPRRTAAENQTRQAVARRA